ncbi:unnamed protein product [Penicillium viridicatum]
MRDMTEHDSKNPHGWEIQVGYALAPLCSEKVIDSSVPRPTKELPKYTRWIFWPRMVASWIYTQVDETLQERIQNMAHRPQYADEVLKELEKEMPRVQFIIEELANTEPKKMNLDKMEQYCKNLQTVAERDTGTINAAQSVTVFG